jgi:hypothetical protein
MNPLEILKNHGPNLKLPRLTKYTIYVMYIKSAGAIEE